MFNKSALTLLITASFALFTTANPLPDPHYRPVQILGANADGVASIIPIARRSSLKRADGVFDTAKALRTVVATNNKYRQNLINLVNNLGKDSLPKGAEIKPFVTLSSVLQTRDLSGSVPLTDINSDTEWAGNVDIGTPSKPFLIDFDTGSSDLWIPSAACVTHDSCDAKHKYDNTSSSTSKPQPGLFRIRYGDNSTVKGDIFTDTVSVGGIKVTDQFLAAATNMSSMFTKDPIDGILGLAWPQISNLNHTPFFHQAIEQKAVSDPRFAFFLNTTASELHIGGVNKDLFKGDIEYHAISNKSIGFWQIANSCVDVNGNKQVASGFEAIIDSGTSIMYGPKAGVKAVYDKIPGSEPVTTPGLEGFYTFPCNSTPKVSFGFGGKQWAISDYNFNLGTITDGSPSCVGALAMQDLGLGDVWLLGDSLMKNVYSVFDVGRKAVGFAELH